MKLITMKKIYYCIKNETPEIELDREIIVNAIKPIRRMLDISEKLRL
jgi:quinolinate synthase